MKKLIAVTVVAIMMFALGASAFALVADTPDAGTQPPVWISGITVSDAWMSGLTSQNWAGALTNNTYAPGNYIWFIARISVASPGGTAAEHMWTGNGEEAVLTVQGKDGCLNLTSANMATLAKINGMSVTARQILNNDLAIVEATAQSAVFQFRSAQAVNVDDDTGTLVFRDDNLATLRLDGIYGADTWIDENNVEGQGINAIPGNDSTSQKDYYLHFMAIVQVATEGVCTATMRLEGEDEFVRQGDTEDLPSAPYSTQTQAYATPSYTDGRNFYWWNGDQGRNDSTYWGNQYSTTTIGRGDRSIPVILFNTVNRISYAIAEINGQATPWSAAQGWRGGFTDAGSIYVVMTPDCADFVVAFHVSGGAFRGLLDWNDDYRSGAPVLDGADLRAAPYNVAAADLGILTDAELAERTGQAGGFNFFSNERTWDAAYYVPLTSNQTSSDAINLVTSHHSASVGLTELQAIFTFFNFAYTNPRAPSDADFLVNSNLTSSAEVKYNVANAVITTPDTTVVIPQTGDAATSTGLILVATAILAAAAVGFVLSKRAYN